MLCVVSIYVARLLNLKKTKSNAMWDYARMESHICCCCLCLKFLWIVICCAMKDWVRWWCRCLCFLWTEFSLTCYAVAMKLRLESVLLMLLLYAFLRHVNNHIQFICYKQTCLHKICDYVCYIFKLVHNCIHMKYFLFVFHCMHFVIIARFIVCFWNYIFQYTFLSSYFNFNICMIITLKMLLYNNINKLMCDIIMCKI